MSDREKAALVDDWVGNALLSRSELFRQLLDPRRDIDSECGYPQSEVGSGAGSINPELYRTLYERECIATRVVQVLPKECWQVQPLVYESEDAETVTPFEEAWDNLASSIRGERSWYQDEKGNPVWEHLRRADILSGIGHFGILLIGIDDGLNLDQPVAGVSSLQPSGQQTSSMGDTKPMTPGYGSVGSVFGPSRNALNYPSRPTKEIEYGPVYSLDPRTGRPVVNAYRKFSESDGDEPVGGRPPVITPSAIREVGEWLSHNGLMPGYGQIYVKGRKAWYVGGDGDEKGFSKLVESRLKGIGFTDVAYEAESFPPKDDGWQLAYRPGDSDNVTTNKIVGHADGLLSGAVGTDAQYVGVQLSPPEFPSDTPSPQQRRLLFLRTYDESLVQIVQYEADVRNPRFGQPVMYRVTLNDPREQHSGIGLPMATVRVHWSRVIHLADNCGSSEIFGVPRLRPVLNRVLDLRKLYSGSAEMYWRGAFPGISLETVPQLGGDVQVDIKGTQDFMEQYMNGLQRYLILMGMSAKTLSPTVVDPSTQIDVQITAICIQLGMPKRVFMGSERGELASSQDDDAWLDRLRERQNNYVTPRIIVPFIDRLIQMGVLPEPRNGKGKNGKPSPTDNADTDDSEESDSEESPMGYSVEWPALDSLGAKDKAGILLQKTQAYAAYVQGGLEAMVPPKDYMTRFDELDEEEAEAVLESAAKSHEAEDTMTMPPQMAGRDKPAPEGTEDFESQQQQQEQFKQMQQTQRQQKSPFGQPKQGSQMPQPPQPKLATSNALTANEAAQILSEYIS
jgi:hypothetical protein